jgi:glycosyltransferase involved in cell wall biosynthesis/peptidoglycan/xylan/chitin deacetylase (PgdA/CDA1 family)
MPSEQAALSVVIPTYNRRERLRICLDALARQTQDPATFEVVVADDGSSDGTAEMVEAMDTPLRLRALRLENGGWAAAANAGAEAARGRVCLQIDDDVLASPQLVAEHVAAHADGAPRMAIGRLIQEPPKSGDWFVGAFTVAWNRRYDELAEREADWRDCFGANFSAPREMLVDAGGFSTDRPAVADMELAFRLHERGCEPTYLPRAEAVHDDEKARERLLSDIAGFGAFAAEFADRRPSTRTQLFGWFGHAEPKEAMLRALLLKLRFPPAALAAAGRLIPGSDRRQVWYDFIARYVFWLAARGNMSRKVWEETTGGVPVLMYHAFTDSGERDRFVAEAGSFERQLKLLKRLRYRTISLEHLAGALRQGTPLPPRSVVITIDDGYTDAFEIARPILRRLGFSATLFPVSGMLGAPSDWNSEGAAKDRAILSPDQVRQLREEGFDVGAHTRSHCKLPTVGEEIAKEEVEGSQADLEGVLGAPVATFAYPYGELDDAAVAIVRQAGFDGACTTQTRICRPGDDSLLIPRLEIMGSDTIRNFLRKLWFGGF